MLWIKSFHIIFVITWFAALFYLPRLFVYHALSQDNISIERFKIMERKLFYGIMTPSGLLTIITGISLWLSSGYSGNWLYLKLVFVGFLIFYHIYCGKLLVDFKYDRNKHTHTYYRWFNEVPAAILIVIVVLVVVKPF